MSAFTYLVQKIVLYSAPKIKGLVGLFTEMFGWTFVRKIFTLAVSDLTSAHR